MKNAGAAWIVPVAAVALLSAVGVAGYSYLSGDCSGGGCFLSSMFCSEAPKVTAAAVKTDEGACPLCPEAEGDAVVSTVANTEEVNEESGCCEGLKACDEGSEGCDTPCEEVTEQPATLVSNPR